MSIAFECKVITIGFRYTNTKLTPAICRASGKKKKKGRNEQFILPLSTSIEAKNMAEPVEDDDGTNSKEEQEEALVALIDHRCREVQNLKQRISYYTSQVFLSQQPHTIFDSLPFVRLLL